MLDLLATWIGLLAWGAHAVVPWRLGRRDDGEERDTTLARRLLWSRAALPLLSLAWVLGALALTRRPEETLAAGLDWPAPAFSAGPAQPLSPLALAVLLMAVSLAAADLLAWAGARRLENAGWRLHGALGALAWLVVAAAAEILRQGGAPDAFLGFGPLLGLAVVCRWLMGLAAGEVLAPGRPLWALAAAVAVPLYLFSLPAPVRSALLAGGWGATAAGAALLWLAARWLPPRLRRPTLAAASLLAALLLSRTVQLAILLTPPDGTLTVPELPMP